MHLYEHDRQDRAIAIHAIHAGGACVTKAGLMTNPLLVHILALVTTDVVRFRLASCLHVTTMVIRVTVRGCFPVDNVPLYSPRSTRFHVVLGASWN